MLLPNTDPRKRIINIQTEIHKSKVELIVDFILSRPVKKIKEREQKTTTLSVEKHILL